MIRMLRFRLGCRIAGYAGCLLAVFGIASGGCGCTLAACLGGVQITLDGHFDARRIILCSSDDTYADFEEGIRIQDTTIQKLLVTVSANGTLLGEQTLEPVYTSSEINGLGCGVCTNAEVHLTIPESVIF